MGLNKSEGDMYDWITHMHASLAGKCLHSCDYCYVQDMAKRFPAVRNKYSGKIRLIEEEMQVKYGKGKTIFIEHLNDLFADDVPDEFICRIITHCSCYPDNRYAFQTKNPSRYRDVNFSRIHYMFLGTTIESNRKHECMGNAPTPFQRITGIEASSRNMGMFHNGMASTFITIEPVLDFDLDEFAEMLIWAEPLFINIGADSKNQNLPEPEYHKVMALYDILVDAGIEVRQKKNLERLKKGMI
jgi:DNA repair photolyase